MTEVVGCRPAIVILHLVDPIVKINPMECVGDSGFPISDSFHVVSPARLEEEKTMFLLYDQVSIVQEELVYATCGPSTFIEYFHCTVSIPETVLCSRGYILYH